MAPRDIRAHCRVADAAEALLRTAITRLGLSARAYHRILKIARTIADLDGAGGLEPKHVSEAIQYRSLDRRIGMPGEPARVVAVGGPDDGASRGRGSAE
jgi:magnesium chelatase family protein